MIKCWALFFHLRFIFKYLLLSSLILCASVIFVSVLVKLCSAAVTAPREPCKKYRNINDDIISYLVTHFISFSFCYMVIVWIECVTDKDERGKKNSDTRASQWIPKFMRLLYRCVIYFSLVQMTSKEKVRVSWIRAARYSRKSGQKPSDLRKWYCVLRVINAPICSLFDFSVFFFCFFFPVH